MTIKTLLFLLFLYVCLAWVGAEYLQPDNVVHYGLLWTAVGLIVVLAFVIGARIFGWWRLWRARRATVRPAAHVLPAAPMLSEDEAALAALIAEANANLAKSPAYAGKRVGTPLAGMPLYLLIGPESTGKTSTFINSGLEPQLLAGQISGTGPAPPTRLCNIWVANDSIFAELAGRVFSGDPARWPQLLKVLRGGSPPATWRQFWRETEPARVLRGVIAFCDAKEFTGTPSSQTLDRRSRDMQERLKTVGEVFGTDFPVYQVFTKCDGIPYFPDFFRRLAEIEANQVFGCTLPVRAGAAEASADETARLLTRTFRPLYQEVAKRRVTQLAHEPDPARRPNVYEFPRELKRIRTPLLQFLSDTFRPHPLTVGPVLRGYYLTGVREVEVAGAALTETRADWGPQKMEATRLFSAADATRMFRAPDVAASMASPKASPGGALVRRWIFTSDLFRNVILADRSMHRAKPVDRQADFARSVVFAGVCGLCLLLCFAFLWSWTRNHALLTDIQQVADAGVEQQGKTAQEKLKGLDDLRVQLQRLLDWDHSTPWGLTWGLYSGSKVLDSARLAYFMHFQNLLLNRLNLEIVTQMRGLPATPPEGEPEKPVYPMLQTHLMITGTCSPANPAVVSKVLRSVRSDLQLAAGSPTEQELADRQIDFYSSELPHENQWRLNVDTDAITQARLYLQNSKGIDRLYRSIVAQVESQVSKPQGLDQLAPNRPKVLRGPEAPSAAYTPEGWKAFEKASKAGSIAASGDTCVTGPVVAGSGHPQDAGTAKRLQAKYIEDYIAQWRDYVHRFSVIPYGGAEDAANKLQTLSDIKSPLLALFFLTSTETSIPVTVAPSALEQVGEKVPFLQGLSGKKKRAEQEAQKAGLLQADATASGPGDISKVFEPVRTVVPPASDRWINDGIRPYVQALSDLGLSMQGIAANRLDQGAQQAAQQNYNKALDAARNIERGFRSVGENGLDVDVQRLLEEPIRNAKAMINTDVGVLAAGQVNADLRRLCASLSVVLRKYPFQPSSKDDVSLDELQKWFGPAGAIWQFQEKSLGDIAQKDGGQWKPKDPSKKPQVTEEMLVFLDRAQAITDVFYPNGATKPHLSYTLRPRLDGALKEATLELEIDGVPYAWNSGFQKQFTWTGEKSAGAVARLRTGQVAYAFAEHTGIWGIFRLMADAEPRPIMGKLVEWKYSRVGERGDAIQPGPVHMEIVEFPGNRDVFNPAFFSFHCPSKAVQ